MATRKPAQKVSLPVGMISIDSVVDADKKAGRKPSPLQATFTSYWEAGNGNGFAIAESYTEDHVNSKGETKTHTVDAFKLYAWAESFLGDRKAVSVRHRNTADGTAVLAVVPSKK